MPKVGGKHYSYDAKGMAQAKAASQRSGQPMTSTRPAVFSLPAVSSIVTEIVMSRPAPIPRQGRGVGIGQA